MPRAEYKNRQFNIILPTDTDLKQWRAAAAKCDVSLNMYIFEMVELAMSKAAQRPVVSKDLQTAREEIFKLREELRLKTMMLEKKEEELFKLQHTPSCPSTYSKELVDRLRTGGTWSTDELIRSLGLNPRDSEVMAIVYKQLQLLAGLGAVTEESRGWRWA